MRVRENFIYLQKNWILIFNWFRISMKLIEEIFVNKILLKGLDIIAEPDSINKLIIKITHNPNVKETKPSRSWAHVQMLRHWCHMHGSIYKSVKLIDENEIIILNSVILMIWIKQLNAPTLNEIIEKNELLHCFIGYMNSVNSIVVLQLYLNLSMFYLKSLEFVIWSTF